MDNILFQHRAEAKVRQAHANKDLCVVQANNRNWLKLKKEDKNKKESNKTQEI